MVSSLITVFEEFIPLCKLWKAGYRGIMKHIFTTFIGFVFSLIAGLALAADPFTVIGIPVDATGQTPIEAQTLAIQDGQSRAAQAIIERLTLHNELSVKALQPIEVDVAAKMIRALEIANEKRSNNRYLGDITVAFNPSEVQKYLKSNGLNMVSTQSRKRLVVPVLDSQSLWEINPWAEVWQDGRYAHALTPISAIPLGEGDDSIINSFQASTLDENALKRLGSRFGVDQLLVVKSSSLTGSIGAEVIDIALDTGQRRNLGRVLGVDYQDLANQIVGTLESDWKQASVSTAENAVSMAVSVLYDSHSEWLRLKDSINGSAQIQDARLDALSKDGALMTITYGGDIGRLRNELAFKGVDVRNDPSLGVVLARTGRF